MIQRLQRPSVLAKPGASVAMTNEPSNGLMGPCKETAQLAAELLELGTSIHKLHLKVTGIGSYAQHKALGDFYEGIPGLVDSVVEQYQGAREKLLEFPLVSISCNSVEEAIGHLRDAYEKTTELQKLMPFSEVTNQLDEVKSLIASTKYKLMFLS